MVQKQAYIALDCGAESARVMVGILHQRQLQLEEQCAVERTSERRGGVPGERASFPRTGLALRCC